MTTIYFTLAPSLLTKVISSEEERFQQKDPCPGYTISFTCIFVLNQTSVVRWRVDNRTAALIITDDRSSLMLGYITTSLINSTVSVLSANLSASNDGSTIVITNGSIVSCELESDQVSEEIIFIGKN